MSNGWRQIFGRRRSLYTLLLVIAFFTGNAQPDDHLVPVTARQALAKKVKHHGYRLQVYYKDDRAELVAFNVSRLTKSLKSIKFRELAKIRRNIIEESSARSLDSVFSSVTALGDQLSYRPPNKNEYERQKLLLLAGKNASPYFHNQWIELAEIDAAFHQIKSFQSRGFLKGHHEYTVDYLPGSVAWEFPSLDPWNCQPGEIQYLKLRKLKGYGVDKIKYDNYTATSRANMRESFEVYFPYNEITPDPAAIKRAVTYLEQNNYVILYAELTGGCSIEGSAERNRYLQVQRAKVLERALQRYNDELIEKDTVMLTDVVAQFRELIRNDHQFKYLDTLNDDKLVNTINRNESLRKKLEPIFTIQRKATLNLVMTKKLTREEQVNKMMFDLNKAASIWHSNKLPSAEGERRVMGILEKLFLDYEKGNMSREELIRILNDTSYPDNLLVFIGYHVLKKYEDKTWPKSKTWLQYWHAIKADEWLPSAHASLLTLIKGSSSKEKKSRYMRMLSDFQLYRFHFTLLGLFPVKELCEIPYPTDPEFVSLALNQYAFLYELSSNSDTTVECVPKRAKVITPGNSPINVDSLVEAIEVRNSRQIYEHIGVRRLKKSFNTQPKSAYYQLLKEHYVKQNKAVLDAVSYESSDAPVQLNEFNLWHLLHDNVNEWSPFENRFYDINVQIDEMEKLIALMKKMDDGLCKPQINSLYLTYHLKVLYHLEQYPEPGNPRHAKYAENALKFISSYYKGHAKVLSPRMALHIAKQLNLFNWLPGPQPGAWYAFDLYNSIAKTRLLTDEEAKLYAHYLKLYNPEMKKLPSPVLDRNKLLALAEEEFK